MCKYAWENDDGNWVRCTLDDDHVGMSHENGEYSVSIARETTYPHRYMEDDEKLTTREMIL